MSIDQNFFNYTNNINTLSSFMALGYINKEHGFKIDKFARANLQNGILSTISSFNENISVNNFKPFNDTLSDLFISSSDALDTHTVTIYYINGDRNLKEEEVVLQGTNDVNISELLNDTIYCIWRMANNSDTDNVGTVEIKNLGGDIYCNMPITSGISANNSLTGIFSVPIGYVGVLIKVSISTEKGADAKGAIFTREEGGVFKYGRALSSYQNQANYDDIYVVATEKTDILPIAVAQTGGVLYLDYTLLVLKKEFIGKNFRGVI